MVQIAAPEGKLVQSARVAPNVTPSSSPLQDSTDGRQMTGLDFRSAAPESPQTYLPRASSNATSSTPPQPGSHVDVKA